MESVLKAVGYEGDPKAGGREDRSAGEDCNSVALLNSGNHFFRAMLASERSWPSGLSSDSNISGYCGYFNKDN